MKFDSAEVAILESVANGAVEKELVDLSELQLALVGGGIGDPVWG